MSCICAGASVETTLPASVPAHPATMSAAPPASVHHGVSVGPGDTLLTRTPAAPNSSDSPLVRFSIAAFAAP